VTDQTGRPVKIIQTPNPKNTHPIENRNFVADISSFKELTTWIPKIDFQTGITLLLKDLSHSSI
jgi:nucleoside-diphosphate-sugar epimerase